MKTKRNRERSWVYTRLKKKAVYCTEVGTETRENIIS